jgi:four helix bundle protein
LKIQRIDLLDCLENSGAMKKVNPIRDKSYAFALQIVPVCQDLQKKNEYVLSKQLLKSGTSIGANVEEALQAQSRKDFIAKLSIALKEACETKYWLRLLADTQYITFERAKPLQQNCEELTSLLTAIIKTTKAT